jgi:hypothetical protein
MTIVEVLKICEFCGTKFVSKRTTAKFCSNTCRTKANNLRRDSERIEAEKIEELAKIAEAKNKAAEARKIKIAEKEAKVSEEKLLEELRLQKQQDQEAADIAEKNRLANAFLEQQKFIKSENEREMLEKIAQKKKADMEKRDKEMQMAKRRGEFWGNVLIEIFKKI